MISPEVCVITLNWNRCSDTLEFLASLRQSHYPNQPCIVVDNGSSDGSAQIIAENYPEVEIICNTSNLGFAGGFNVGLRRALTQSVEYVFVVNNDTWLAPNTLSALVLEAEDPQVGAVAPVIFYATQPDKIWSAGAGRNPLTLDLTDNHNRRRIFTQPLAVEFISGCAMLIKRRVLEQVGLFDEKFFMYYEDSDYCLRIRQANFKLLVTPQAKLWHKVSVSSEGSDSPTERYWMGYSSVLFFRKHLTWWQWPIILFWRTLSTLRTVGRLSYAGQFQSARAYLRGEKDAWLAKFRK